MDDRYGTPRKGLVEEVKVTAQLTRDEGWWSAYVPEVDRTTQARHLREVKEMVADLVHIMTDTSKAEIEVDLRLPEGPDA